jgi:hypothetical protein
MILPAETSRKGVFVADDQTIVVLDAPQATDNESPKHIKRGTLIPTIGNAFAVTLKVCAEKQLFPRGCAVNVNACAPALNGILNVESALGATKAVALFQK